ncbi:MAG TPA: histidinol dehydrogenase [Desulfobacterales bacterium]|nr:histidinol dehydrogenase [Desulfobacterales bacterium]
MSILTPVLLASDEGRAVLRRLEDRFQATDPALSATVAEIIAAVRERGDEALVAYTRRFDAPEMTADRLRVAEEEFAAARRQVSDAFLAALRLAAERIRRFHEQEVERSWLLTREDGAVTGRLVRPVDGAGLYVPGGQGGSTPLVSSVLMNGIPAAIAGVGRTVMVTPPDAGGGVHPALLVAAQEAGIAEVYKVGSAWAIAALAYGTATIAPVDVVVGPGNQYVTEAKRQVAGRVRIDMIAGPSEVLIVADESARPAAVAADLLAQAEHDPQALPMLIATDKGLVQRVAAELETQLAGLARRDIAERSLRERGVALIASDTAAALEAANRIAAEHLELMVADPYAWLGRVRHAGAVFLGHWTPESAGDYVAGPNHVLPTMGTARFSSALGVETFVKKTSVIGYTPEALAADADAIVLLAELEGLTAHARSAALRAGKLWARKDDPAASAPPSRASGS